MTRFLQRLLDALLSWPALALVSLAAILLGLIGFRASAAAQGGQPSGLDLLYLTLQLFVLQSGVVPGPVPPALEAARFLAPAAAAYGAFKGIVLLFSDRWERFKAGRLSDHLVIAGLGRKGLALARSALARGERVVAIQLKSGTDRIEAFRAAGGLVFIGDARDPRTLVAAGVTRARVLVAITEDDGVNAEIAVQGREVARGRSATLQCVAHVVDPRLCALLREQGLEADVEESFRLEFFNVFERGAAQLLDEHPLPVGPSGVGAGDAHVVIVGIGRFGESVLVEASRRWRPASPGARLRVTVVDRLAEPKARAVQMRHPRVRHVCEIEAVSVEFSSPEFQRAAFLFDEDGRCTASAIYVCLDGDSAALSAALLLRGRVQGHGASVVVRTTHESGVAQLLDRGSVRGEGQSLHVFPLIDRTCCTGLILEGGTRDLLARAIHQDYLDQRRAEGATPETNPSMQPWHELPKSLQESCRAQADHLGEKLRAVSCALGPLGDTEATPFEFTPDEVERLAEMEHERFVEERIRDGWTQAPEKDIEAKRSPYLVPWSDLSFEIQDYDRKFVRGLPQLLAKIDLRINRVRPAGATSMTGRGLAAQIPSL